LLEEVSVRIGSWFGVSVFLFCGSFALAQAGYSTDFEDGGANWVVQFLNDQARWKFDSAPLVFTSPTTTLNNADQIPITAPDQDNNLSAIAYSPSIFFGGPGERFLKWMCYYNQDPTPGHVQPTRETLWGSSLITHPPVLRIGMTPTAEPGTDFNLPCSPEGSWHQHLIHADAGLVEADTDGDGDLDPLPPAIAAKGTMLRNLIVQQVAFKFTWKWDQHGNPPVIQLHTQFWAIDDFFLQDLLTNPFAPAPSVAGGGGTGGSSEGCFSSFVGIHPRAPFAGSALVLLVVLWSASLCTGRRVSLTCSARRARICLWRRGVAVDPFSGAPP
jgi:hypothetical protein